MDNLSEWDFLFRAAFELQSVALHSLTRKHIEKDTSISSSLAMRWIARLTESYSPDWRPVYLRKIQKPTAGKNFFLVSNESKYSSSVYHVWYLTNGYCKSTPYKATWYVQGPAHGCRNVLFTIFAKIEAEVIINNHK